MFVAWGIFATLSFWSARNRSNPALGKRWFKLHVIAASATVLFTTAGAILISFYFEWHFFPLDHPHHWLGFFIMLALAGQVILGIVIHWLWDPSRRGESEPWYDILHWYLGRSAYVASFFEMYLGISMLTQDAPNTPTFIMALFLLFTALVASVFLLGQVLAA